MIPNFLRWHVIFGLLLLLMLNPVKGENTRILWDTSHGIQWRYSPDGRYHALKNFLDQSGFAIEQNLNELDNNLSPNKFKVLVLTVAVEDPYQKKDAKNIKQFVQDGGGLLILCDNPQYVAKSKINIIISPFGIECGTASFSYESFDLKNFVEHSIFSGVSTVNLASVGALKAISPARVVASDPNKNMGLIAVAKFEAGKVIVVADLDVFRNQHVDDNRAQNKQFACFSVACLWK